MPDSPDLIGNTDVVTYRGLETVCFSYVNPVGQPDEQTMSYISNWVDLSSIQVQAGYNNGQLYTSPYPSQSFEGAPPQYLPVSPRIVAN